MPPSLPGNASSNEPKNNDDVASADDPIGLMSAMTEEIDSLLPELRDRKTEVHGRRTYHIGTLWGRSTVVVFSRWGKVAAASTATILVDRFGCSEIVFTGVAGGVARGLNVGDVVVADRLVQHDMDATPIFSPREVPLLGVTEFSTDPIRRDALLRATESFLSNRLRRDTTEEQRLKFGITDPKVVTGLAASGDKFFSSKEDLDRLREDLPGVSCVEMEGAAVAQVCYEHGVPFSVVRTISDGADDGAHIDFQAFVKEIATVYSHGILELTLQSR